MNFLSFIAENSCFFTIAIAKDNDTIIIRCVVAKKWEISYRWPSFFIFFFNSLHRLLTQPVNIKFIFANNCANDDRRQCCAFDALQLKCNYNAISYGKRVMLTINLMWISKWDAKNPNGNCIRAEIDAFANDKHKIRDEINVISVIFSEANFVRLVCVYDCLFLPCAMRTISVFFCRCWCCHLTLATSSSVKGQSNLRQMTAVDWH